MKQINLFSKIVFVFLFFAFSVYSQSDNSHITVAEDSIKSAFNTALLETYKQRISEFEELQKKDSLMRVELENLLNSLRITDSSQKQELQNKLDELQANEASRLAKKKSQIESLREIAVGYPVLGPLNDTLFYIYNGMGASTASQRAENITYQIKKLYKNDFIKVDSIKLSETDSSVDIVYGETIIMSVIEADALWFSETETSYDLAEKNKEIIHTSIKKAISEHFFSRTLMQIGLTLLVLIVAILLIWLINKLYKKSLALLPLKTNKLLKNLEYRGYTFLSTKQEMAIILFLFNIFRWFLIFLSVYLILPVVFSIFPVTREWTGTLFDFIWLPFKKIFLSIWNFIPNFISMLIIFFVFRYLIRFVRYVFNGIASGKLKLSGFYPDWAMPTFHIIKILLWALAFVMIYSASPLVDSPVFAGVSVFLGLLISLGSSSAIANIVAGLVITYMRPFKVGDRIQFGDKVGDVIEKSLLVTRLRTIKNEEITIPNSTMLTGNTVNYSSFCQNEGLIIHANVAMGYDNAWQDIHQALLDAASKTDNILKEPKPFVLQVSLDDFYVTYQINAYIRNANAQSKIYSDLNQNIQDIFNERGFELLCPHYEVNHIDKESDKITNNAKTRKSEGTN